MVCVFRDEEMQSEKCENSCCVFTYVFSGFAKVIKGFFFCGYRGSSIPICHYALVFPFLTSQGTSLANEKRVVLGFRPQTVRNV